MAKLVTVSEALARQTTSNRSGIGHEAHFAAHRARVTAEIERRAPGDGRGRLCLLGAGNAHDVDLSALTARFREVHLVDVDAEAIERACAGVTDSRRSRVIAHAPVDASGILPRLDAWSRMPPSPGAVSEEIDRAVARVVASLPGPYDVVVSCCLLTQMQLVLLEAVGDENPRFGDLRAALGRIHVRTLGALLGSGGVALLVTDLTSNETYPALDDLSPEADLSALMSHLISVGNVIHSAHPGLLSAEMRRDPVLKAAYAVRFPIGPWIWQNGPRKTFLVYAMEIAVREPGSS